MLIAAPIVLAIALPIALPLLVANQAPPPADIVSGPNDDVEKAQKLRTDAMGLYRRAEATSGDEAKRVRLCVAEGKLRKAQAPIDHVRDMTPPPGPGMEDPFEADTTKINESLKLVRAAIRASRARARDPK